MAVPFLDFRGWVCLWIEFVIGRWAGVDFVWEQRKLEARKMPASDALKPC